MFFHPLGKDALKKYNLPIIEDYVVASKGFTPRQGIKPTKRLLSLQERPDAIFTINVGVAIGAMYVLKDAGISIPDEISNMIKKLGRQIIACLNKHSKKLSIH